MHFNQFLNISEKCMSDTFYEMEKVLNKTSVVCKKLDV